MQSRWMRVCCGLAIWLTIGDYILKKGKDVNMSQYAVHRNPNWFPSPEQFKPERWRATLMLSMTAQRFDFELVPGQRIVPQPSITMRPKYGLKVRVKALA